MTQTDPAQDSVGANPRLFAGTLARAVRADVAERVDAGEPMDSATDAVCRRFAEAAASEPVTFWVALAVTQSLLGQLQPEVGRRAVELIEAGGDQEQWAAVSPRLGRRRGDALWHARDQLLGIQPKPKRRLSKADRAKLFGPPAHQVSRVVTAAVLYAAVMVPFGPVRWSNALWLVPACLAVSVCGMWVFDRVAARIWPRPPRVG